LRLEAQSRLFIPHYALTVFDVPGLGASWSETVRFAGSFDGFVVFPEIQGMEQFMIVSRENFARDGSLPEGLTMLRTALFAEAALGPPWRRGQPRPRYSLRPRAL